MRVSCIDQQSPLSRGVQSYQHHGQTSQSAIASRAAPTLAGTWAGRCLRCLLALLALAAATGGSTHAADADAQGGSPAARPAATPAPAGLAGDDFTGMNLQQLMQVEVPLVYGASKHEQKITEAPSAVSIITADEIKRNGHRTLRDVLNNVRGFYVTYDRMYSYIGVRGVNRPGDFGGRILITVDGHRMNDPIYDSALSGTEGFLDVDLIDRVEVIRGPGSSLYGNNAVFAVINVITRKAGSFNWGEVSASAGSFDTYIARFTLGHAFTNGVEFLASGTVRDSVGQERLRFPQWDTTNVVNNGVAEDLDHDHGNHFFAALRYEGLSLSGGYNDRKKENGSAAVGVVFNEKPAFYYDQRAFVELKYQHEFAHDWSVLGRVFFDHYHFDSDYIFDYGGAGNPADFALNRDESLSQFWGGEAQVTKTFLDKHRITAGGEFRDDLHLTLKNFDVSPRAVYTDTENNADNFGLYAQGEAQPLEQLTLNAGVRYDRFPTFGDSINPRAALIYSPWKGTAFKLLYGQAFRAPNAFERGYVGPTYVRNPDLKAERMRSGEVVWEQGLAKNYRLTTAFFYNKIDDLITKQTTSGGQFIFRNTDSVDDWGGEVELEAQWAGGWRGRASYTFAHATDSDTGDRLSNSPEHVGKFSLTAPLYQGRFFANFELQAMSDRLTVRNREVDSFAICNFTLFGHELFKGLDASISIYNLFDTDYSDPGAVDFRQRSIPQDGRTFRAKLTWSF
jgi:iron complex outermembrane receptor protein